MKNILSYIASTSFTGKEIKDWIDYNISHETSHMKQALHMRKYYSNIRDDRVYIISSTTMTFNTCGGSSHPYPQVWRAN